MAKEPRFLTIKAFEEFVNNDFHDLKSKVSRIAKLQWTMIGISVAVLGVALAILAEYVFRG